MPNLTVDQIVDAARALTVPQQRRVIDELERHLSREEAIKEARRIRPKYQLPPAERKRLSPLLQKGNEGLLTDEEKRELDRIIDEYEQRALEMGEELARTVKGSPRKQRQNRNGEDA